jgi:hypothetical protein
MFGAENNAPFLTTPHTYHENRKSQPELAAGQ